MKHKHADVLIAIAEGKKVQWRSSIESVWVESCLIDVAHIGTGEFRIKPEPKPDVVKYIHFDADSHSNDIFIDDDDLENKHSHWDLHLKVIIDGETGKLKKAEVL